jgi:hypothetical protein|tara:strand:- start:179 stop:358 length:180 start_codon:yes stop_codon:yes gene_type:complete
MVLLGIVRNNEERNTMTKEKKTFAWDTVLNMSVASGKMTVKGTDIEVVWCPVTKMFWEI